MKGLRKNQNIFIGLKMNMITHTHTHIYIYIYIRIIGIHELLACIGFTSIYHITVCLIARVDYLKEAMEEK